MASNQFKKTCVALLITQLAPVVANAATISVDGINCTLSEAIKTANDGSAQTGCMQGDAVGPDTIEINADIVLTNSVSSFNGLEFINSDITINGNNHSVVRSDIATDNFRLMPILGGTVVLNDLTLAQGRLQAPYRGAGIYLDSDASLTLNRCNLSDNSAGQSGGAIYSKGVLALNESTIETSVADQFGGGLHVTNGTLNISDSTLRENTASWGGGLHAIRPALVTVVNSDITHNVATGEQGNGSRRGGSGVYFDDLQSASITGGSIAYNQQTSTGRGGGILINRGNTNVIEDVHIHHNNAGIGAGIHLRDGVSHQLRSNLISQNTGSSGTGVSFQLTRAVEVKNTQIVDNSASSGGAGISDYGSIDLVVSETTISGNMTESTGGGISLRKSNSLSIVNSTVSNNTAWGGGGVSASNNIRNFRLVNSTISGNVATGSNGGGIAIRSLILAGNVDSNIFILLNSTITNNSSVLSGGGVITQNVGNLMFANSIISGNRADVSGNELFYEAQGSGFNIQSNNVWGDSGESFDDAFESVANVFVPSNSDILATSDAGASGALARNIGIASILKPLADNGGFTLTHKLGTSSPAIDAGGDNFFPSLNVVCPESDQRGELRSKPCDIGAYETEGQSCFVVKSSNGKVFAFCL